jgi:hypothetical protein
VLTPNQVLWIKFQVFTGSPIHPPSRCSQLTTKLENINITLGASLVEIPEIMKKDASTSSLDLIDDSNPCN